MHSKKRMIFTSAILCAAVTALLSINGEPVHADSSSLGLVYVSGTATNQLDGKAYSVNVVYVRLPGSSTWLPGSISIVGNGLTVVGEDNTQPFLANMGPWEDAFTGAVTATINGQPATLAGILQGPPLNRLIVASVSGPQFVAVLDLSSCTVIVNP